MLIFMSCADGKQSKYQEKDDHVSNLGFITLTHLLLFITPFMALDVGLFADLYRVFFSGTSGL